jgi:hypothetical protein
LAGNSLAPTIHGHYYFSSAATLLMKDLAVRFNHFQRSESLHRYYVEILLNEVQHFYRL